MAEGRLKVSDEIFSVFDTARQTNEIVENASLLALLKGHGSVRHDGRVIAEGFNATEGLSESENREIFHELARFANATLESERDDTAVVEHLFLGELVLGVRGETRIGDLLDARMLFEEFSDELTVLAVAFHANVEGLGTSYGEEGVESRRDSTDRILQKSNLLQKLRAATDSDTHDDVTVTVEVFGDGVDDHISAEFEGKLAIGGHKSVVDYHEQLVLVSNFSKEFDIDDF